MCLVQIKSLRRVCDAAGPQDPARGARWRDGCREGGMQGWMEKGCWAQLVPWTALPSDEGEQRCSRPPSLMTPAKWALAMHAVVAEVSS